MIAFAKYQYPIVYMPLEARRNILPKHSICSIAPSEERSDHMITANGSHWMDIAGHPYEDEHIFRQEMLYRPQWKETPMPPDMRPVLPKLRKLLLEGKNEEIVTLINDVQSKTVAGKYMTISQEFSFPANSLHRHNAFRLTYHQPAMDKTWNYLRWLDTQNGLVSTIWTNERGSFKSESFSAYDGDFTITRLSAEAKNLDVDVIFHAIEEDQPAEFIQCMPDFSVRPGILSYQMAYEKEYGDKGYISMVRVIPQGGTMECLEKGFRIAGAESLLVLTRTISYRDHFSEASVEGAEQALLDIQPDFEKLLSYNEEYIGTRMDRSRIHIGKPEDWVLSGEELLRRTHSEQSLDPMMLEKLYDHARFFQIYDTGVHVPPSWGQHNINTNLQVCAGNNTGLFDEMDSYFRFYESKFEDFRTNAKLLYGARGLLATIHCDPDSGLLYHSSHTYPHFCWTGCLGWIFNELWGYWLVTGDREFLRNRIIPGLKEIALFFEDYACDRGDDGRVIFYPSFSPENATPKVPGVPPIAINSVMDIAICREVLVNLIDGCRTLGIEDETIPHWEAQLDSLPIYLLDEEGGLKEWAWPTLRENYNHRHVSHHYEVWPGRIITPESEPELAEAIRISNRKRGQQDDSAHGIIHRAFTAIRLKDTEEMWANVAQLMTQGFVRRNLYTNHYPYRMHCPDLLGAMPALLLEMAVFSMPGLVEFLPAMPDELPQGALDGIWLYTWAKLEHLEWDTEHVYAVIRSNEEQTLTLRCGRSVKSITINGEEAALDGDHAEYAFKAGETVEITIAF